MNRKQLIHLKIKFNFYKICIYIFTEDVPTELAKYSNQYRDMLR